jgi:hypothetical protein
MQQIWDGIYRNVSNFQQIIETPLPNQQNYIAISKIMKAHYMQYIVDFMVMHILKPLKTTTTPAYTDDAVIYKELVKN